MQQFSSILHRSGLSRISLSSTALYRSKQRVFQGKTQRILPAGFWTWGGQMIWEPDRVALEHELLSWTGRLTAYTPHPDWSRRKSFLVIMVIIISHFVHENLQEWIIFHSKTVTADTFLRFLDASGNIPTHIIKCTSDFSDIGTQSYIYSSKGLSNLTPFWWGRYSYHGEAAFSFRQRAMKCQPHFKAIFLQRAMKFQPHFKAIFLRMMNPKINILKTHI